MQWFDDQGNKIFPSQEEIRQWKNDLIRSLDEIDEELNALRWSAIDACT